MYPYMYQSFVVSHLENPDYIRIKCTLVLKFFSSKLIQIFSKLIKTANACSSK